jgi:hypothetical protein
VANDAAKLAEHGITRVVTVLSDAVSPLPDVSYLHIALSDAQGKESEDCLRSALPVAVKFIGALLFVLPSITRGVHEFRDFSRRCYI